MAKRECVEAISQEVARWPGVQVTFERKRKHLVARVAYQSRERIVVMSGTASDWRSTRNTVSDMRKELRSIGARRKDANHAKGS